MSRPILAGLLGAVLVFGVWTAFAEEPSMSDQEILKAWGVPVTGDHVTAPLAFELKPGLTPLTDETLDEITGAGMGFVPLGAVVPTPVLRIDPLDPPKIASAIDVLVPFPALQVPLGEQVSIIAQAEVPINSGPFTRYMLLREQLSEFLSGNQ